MAKKKTARKTAPKVHKKVAHRHFRPSYDAHPAFHLFAVIVIIFFMAVILSYILFAMQNPALFA
jgi:hypothetical protein